VTEPPPGHRTGWRTLRQRCLHDGRPWLTLFAEDVELPGGRVLEGFYRIEAPDFAVIVPLAEDGRIVAVRQYKHGARRVSLTLPAGYVEPGEAPRAAAQRELREETGYAAPDWYDLGRFVVDGNRGTGHAHLFLACDARPVAAVIPDDAEEGEVVLVAPEAFRAGLFGGDVALLPTAAAFGLALASPEGAARLGARRAEH
jgi:ADP-ribose pyrophosphatase